MSEHEAGRTDQLWIACLPSRQGDHPKGSIRQGHPRGDRRPSRDRWALQAKENEGPTEEAFDRGAFAQLLSSPRWGQPIAALLAFGVLRQDSGGASRISGTSYRFFFGCETLSILQKNGM